MKYIRRTTGVAFLTAYSYNNIVLFSFIHFNIKYINLTGNIAILILLGFPEQLVSVWFYFNSPDNKQLQEERDFFMLEPAFFMHQQAMPFSILFRSQFLSPVYRIH